LPLQRPRHYHNIAAIGAALRAIEEDNTFVFDVVQLDKIAEYSRGKRQYAPPLSDSLCRVAEESLSVEPHIEEATEVVLGIDGGSTTTKGALVDLRTGKLLDKLYIKTHGNPEGSLKQVLNSITLAMMPSSFAASSAALTAASMYGH